MGKKRSKRYVKSLEMIKEGKVYSLEEASSLIKKFPEANFDSTVSISLKMGADPKKSDQMVRGACALPNGSGKNVKVLVFAEGEAANEAKNSGADHVGFKSLIEEVKKGFSDFDVVIATPSAMAEVRKLGRQLGPRGLMPNPKIGTVTDNVSEAIKLAKSGRVDFRLDKNSNIATPVGKISFDEDKLIGNIKAVINAIASSRPSSVKGDFILTATLASTVGPGVKFDVSSF